MIKYLQLPYHFDVQRMQQELMQLADGAWKLHYQKLHYEGEWSAIPLRSINGDSQNIFLSTGEHPVYKNTIFLKDSFYLQEILSFFKCQMRRVRLLKLNAGAVIKEHTDAELCFEKGEIRIHIPVVTNDEVEFYLDKERIDLKEGECWYMNFNLPHSIINKSKTDRVHLVIDAEVNDWVKELFDQPSVCRKEIDEPDYDNDTRQKIIAQLRQLNTETGDRLANEMEAALTIQHER